jgi:hypothetical protein
MAGLGSNFTCANVGLRKGTITEEPGIFKVLAVRPQSDAICGLLLFIG